MQNELTVPSTMLKGFMDVWGEGETWEELEASISSCPSSKKDPWLGQDVSFKIAVETYGFRMGQEQKIEAIRKLEFIPFQVRNWDRIG